MPQININLYSASRILVLNIQRLCPLELKLSHGHHCVYRRATTTMPYNNITAFFFAVAYKEIKLAAFEMFLFCIVSITELASDEAENLKILSY